MGVFDGLRSKVEVFRELLNLRN